MISTEHGCIFVHIPKTGGQSIETAFLELHGLTWETRQPLLLRYNKDPSKGPQRLAHLRADEYVNYGYIGPADFRRFFKFAFVRNPWDRLVSEYRYRRPRSSFRDFAINRLVKGEDYTDVARHMMPQSAYIIGPDGRTNVNFIGRFETLESDFRQVAERLNLGNVSLPHRNAAPSRGLFQRLSGKRKPYQSYYDSRTRELVSDFYAEDIERFGYSFDADPLTHLSK